MFKIQHKEGGFNSSERLSRPTQTHLQTDHIRLLITKQNDAPFSSSEKDRIKRIFQNYVDDQFIEFRPRTISALIMLYRGINLNEFLGMGGNISNLSRINDVEAIVRKELTGSELTYELRKVEINARPHMVNMVQKMPSSPENRLQVWAQQDTHLFPLGASGQSGAGGVSR